MMLSCAVLCRAVPCRAVPCRAVPCRAVSCRAAMGCAVLCSHYSAVLCQVASQHHDTMWSMSSHSTCCTSHVNRELLGQGGIAVCYDSCIYNYWHCKFALMPKRLADSRQNTSLRAERLLLLLKPVILLADTRPHYTMYQLYLPNYKFCLVWPFCFSFWMQHSADCLTTHVLTGTLLPLFIASLLFY